MFVAAVVVLATVEAITREQLVWRGAPLAVTVGLAFLLPWRRVRPLPVFMVCFGTASAVEALSIVGDVTWDGLDTSAFMLVLPYALTRWASGRDVGIGLLVMTVPLTVSGVAGHPGGNLVGGALIVGLGYWVIGGSPRMPRTDAHASAAHARAGVAEPAPVD